MSNFLVIGASSGIGLQTANQLVAAGHRVYGTYFRNSIQPVNEKLTYHYVNVLDENPVVDFLPESLNGLVYCPGTISLKPFERFQPTDFINDYNLQVLGAVKILQAVIKKMKIAGEGSVVLFSTVAVQSGLNFHSLVSTSKGAIEGLTRALAAEYAPSIRVNCIAPSLTDTPLASSLLNTEQKKEAGRLRHPLKRVGTVEDMANIAEFLLTKKSGWITGQIFHVDGGLSTLKV